MDYEPNGNNNFWKPVALSLMSAMVVFVATAASTWPRDTATSRDVAALRQEIADVRMSMQNIAVELSALRERTIRQEDPARQ
jgi:hypothetical protein